MFTTDEHGRRNGQRPLRGFIVDSAYATIGLGGATDEAVRSIDRRRLEAPRQASVIGGRPRSGCAPPATAGWRVSASSSTRALPPAAACPS
jgi:hypothetical protein